MSSSWLDGVLPSPDARKALTGKSFAVDMLPVFLCYYFTALLVLIPDTFLVRLVLLPFTIWSALRTMTTVDLALTYNDLRYSNSNQGIAIAMVVIIMRVVEWTFYTKPPKRTSTVRHAQSNVQSVSNKAESKPRDVRKIAIDALDLTLNLRGIGWDWLPAQPPPSPHSTDSTPHFLMQTTLAMLRHALSTDIFQYIIQSMSPSTFGSHAGGTIFDPSLTPLLRYTRSTLITILGGLVVYCSLSAEYSLFACIGIIVFRQHPSQWPPLFHSPWRSTSLVEMWGKRWHQAFRSNFTFVGSRPLSVFFGRVGKVFGAFLVSGLVHDIGLWGIGRGTDFLYVGGYFLMMAVGVILEGLWRAVFGKKVGGTVGWAWTVMWTVGWANLLIDAWFRRGVAACSVFPEDLRPVKLIEGYLPGIYRQT